MKIAIITPYLVGKAGGERLTLDLANSLKQLNHDVEIFCYAKNEETCYTELMKTVKINSVTAKGAAHATIHSKKNLLNRYLGFTRPAYELYMMRKLANRIPKGFDVLLCLNQPSEWAAYFAKKRLQIPAVWICNEPPFYHDKRIHKGIIKTLLGLPFYKVLDMKAARSMDKVIALSKLYKKYTDNVYGIDSQVEYIGTNNNRVTQTINIRTQFNIPETALIALFVGSFVDYKRPQDAIEAIEMIPGAVLFLVGEGKDEEKYRKLARHLGVEKRVFFVSRVSEEVLESFYSQCDCLIFTAEQSWGLVIPEAMLRGKPVITCPETGASEIVQDGKTGFVISPRNPAEIAWCMEQIMLNPDYEYIGKAAKEWVEQNLSQENYAKRIETALVTVVKDG
jgi:glycosyltransferase involved in cell wall biosynthesis